ncbi:hypothetical protein JKP88DRAFT_203976 [Tribonema minus]|uniref:Zeta toxin domain-containing protein n=1 Tax=Tribonema minus TaxID=303371 RepID=A0A835YGB3_9STRA|nr:hypothetical protein JKP88DRAFT_203976 [Tribonema minus]
MVRLAMVMCVLQLGTMASALAGGRPFALRFATTAAASSALTVARCSSRPHLPYHRRCQHIMALGDLSEHPLLITIGPQCAGKTTTLRKMGVFDVAIDEHPDVYYELPTAYILDPTSTTLEDVTIFGRRLSDRLQYTGVYANMLVAQRLEGLLSSAKFEAEWKAIAGPYLLADRDVDRIFLESVEAAVAEGVRLYAPTVDLFLPEGHAPKGMREHSVVLRYECHRRRGAVAWGNTNTRARDYAAALATAQECTRPVHFVRYGHEIPAISIRELFGRNLRRFAATGRFIPPQTMWAARQRVKHLYARTGGGEPARLAAAAGFIMDDEGRVRAEPTSHAAAALALHVAPRAVQSPWQQQQQQQQRWRQQRGYAAAGGAVALALSPAAPPLPWDAAAARIADATCGAWEALTSSAAAAAAAAAAAGRGARGSRRGEWSRIRAWRHMQWTREDLDPQFPPFLDPKNGTGNGVKKTGDSYVDFDTIDLVKIIKGDKNDRYKF